MKKLTRAILLLAAILTANTISAAPFTVGADISVSTELEAHGNTLYNYSGQPTDPFLLAKDMGLQAVRLRVWVDPTQHGGWCNIDDTLAKALRAKKQGLDIMIDFHYSDWWADPGQQNIPESWKKHKYKVMLQDLAEHTRQTLKRLKDNGVDVKWVQVGNETTNGMLWTVKKKDGKDVKDADGQPVYEQSMGHVEKNPEQYAGFFKAGYEAVKAVYPEAKVIVHLDKGYSNALYTHNLDILRNNGAKWDLIGMSIYPYWSRDYEEAAPKLFAECIRNIKQLYQRYATDCMVVETGFEMDEENPWKMESGREQLRQLLQMCSTQTDGHCLGVFYWEPYMKPSNYRLGAFTEDGHPTSIMRAFTTFQLCRGEGSVKYDRPVVHLQTTEGDIDFELYNETPLHRDNFISLVNRGVLDSTLFHRVVEKFMIQGGDPASKNAAPTSADSPAGRLGYTNATDATGKDYTVPAEIIYPRFFCKRGAIAAAREADAKNPERRSSASQFFFVWGNWPAGKKAGAAADPLPYYSQFGQAGLPSLDGEYTVFGEVIRGFDVIEKIQRLQTDSYERPLRDVRILKATVK